MSVYPRLLKFVRPHSLRLAGAMFSNIIAAALDAFSIALLIPFLNTLFDRDPLDIKAGWVSDLLNNTIGHFVVEGDKMGSLLNGILAIAVVVLLKNFFVWLSGQLGASLQENVTRDLRSAVYRHLVRLPLGYFTETKAGQIFSRVLNDTSEARLILTHVVTQALQATAVVLATIAFLFGISWELTLLSLTVVPILLLILQPMLRRLRRGNRKRGLQHGEMASVLQETVGGIKLVKAYSGEVYEEQRFETANMDYSRNSVRLTRLALTAQPLTETLGMLIALLVLWTGGREVLVDQSMSGADLITFLLYVLRLLQPLKQLTIIPANAQASLAAAERIFTIIDTPAEYEQDQGDREMTGFTKDIVFENVCFSYDGSRENLVLKDVSFKASRGEVVALVGASGAGKTTLVDLIPRFYSPIAGRILIDGVDIATMRLGSLRSHIGMVSQDTVLFHDTVRANIAYGADGKHTHDEIVAAAKAANAHEFIENLPQGYDTILGERGTLISGGQRQRLSIARALLYDPPILILDEATSALDTESERLVQEAIEKLLEGRTVFMIAHRLSTVQNACQILVFDDGRLVETGTHEQLLVAEGVYSRLHSLQFNNGNTVSV